jgi:PadR family transcriptional regulator PadR
MLWRMRSTSFFVLASLLDSRRHGYGIVQHVRVVSEGQVTLTTGTLYGALDRLRRDGLIADDGDEVVDGRNRRYYRLTSAGARAVQEEAARMRRAADVVDSQITARAQTA